MHTHQIAADITTNEAINSARYPYLQKDGLFHNPFDRCARVHKKRKAHTHTENKAQSTHTHGKPNACAYDDTQARQSTASRAQSVTMVQVSSD